MSQPPWPAAYGLDWLDEIDSTNAEALRRAAAGEGGPRWIAARRQRSARGRRGRPWAMPEGNLAATLLMTVPGGAGEAALRSFVAALALRDALVAVTGRPEAFALKWPNDVLMHGGKLAGILLEGAGGRAAATLAIGFGVNLAAAPDPRALEPGAVQPVALTALTGDPVPPETFLAHLAAAFAPWEDRLSAEGFAPIRTAWLASAARLGQTITAKLVGDSISGTFRTVDEAGALVIEAAGVRRVLPAAEVFFP